MFGDFSSERCFVFSFASTQFCPFPFLRFIGKGSPCDSSRVFSAPSCFVRGDTKHLSASTPLEEVLPLNPATQTASDQAALRM